MFRRTESLVDIYICAHFAIFGYFLVDFEAFSWDMWRLYNQGCFFRFILSSSSMVSYGPHIDVDEHKKFVSQKLLSTLPLTFEKRIFPTVCFTIHTLLWRILLSIYANGAVAFCYFWASTVCILLSCLLTSKKPGRLQFETEKTYGIAIFHIQYCNKSNCGLIS